MPLTWRPCSHGDIILLQNDGLRVEAWPCREACGGPGVGAERQEAAEAVCSLTAQEWASHSRLVGTGIWVGEVQWAQS